MRGQVETFSNFFVALSLNNLDEPRDTAVSLFHTQSLSLSLSLALSLSLSSYHPITHTLSHSLSHTLSHPMHEPQ
jgi:hypothetical protein